MQEHATSGIISVQVLEEEINFNTNIESIMERKVEMITLHEELDHSVKVKESVFLSHLQSLEINKPIYKN